MKSQRRPSDIIRIAGHHLDQRFVLVVVLLGFALLLAACGPGPRPPAGWSGPVLSDGSLYVGSRDGKMLAIDQQNGAIRWEYPPGSDFFGYIYSTPTVSDNRVFYGNFPISASLNGKVYAVDVKTGLKQWEFPTGRPIVGDVATDADRVYAGSEDGKLYALTKQDGLKVWESPAGDSIWAGPVVSGDAVYVGTMKGDFLKFNAATGARDSSFSFKAGGAIAAPPLVTKDAVYVGSFDRTLYALDVRSGQVKWRRQSDNWFWTRPVEWNGIVYAAGMDKKLYAFDAATGQVRWTFDKALAALRAWPVVADGLVVVAAVDGRVFAVDARTGDQRWDAAAGSPVYAPLSTDGKVVYVSATSKEIIVLDVKAGNKLSPIKTEK